MIVLKRVVLLNLTKERPLERIIGLYLCLGRALFSQRKVPCIVEHYPFASFLAPLASFCTKLHEGEPFNRNLCWNCSLVSSRRPLPRIRWRLEGRILAQTFVVLGFYKAVAYHITHGPHAFVVISFKRSHRSHSFLRVICSTLRVL